MGIASGDGFFDVYALVLLVFLQKNLGWNHILVFSK